MRFGGYAGYPMKSSQTHIMSLRIILTVKEKEYWICGCGYKPTDFDSFGGSLSLINMAIWIKKIHEPPSTVQQVHMGQNWSTDSPTNLVIAINISHF